MSVEFSSDPIAVADFDGQAQDGTFPNTSHTIPDVGCAGGVAYACSGYFVSGPGNNGNPWLYKTRVADTNTITLRAQVAAYVDPTIEAVGNVLAFRAESKSNTPATTGFGSGLYGLSLNTDGSVGVQINDAVETFSAAGQFPWDGLPHGLQFSLNRTSATACTATVAVDGATVYTVSETFLDPIPQFGRSYVFCFRGPLCGQYPPPGYEVLDPDSRFKGYVTTLTAVSSMEVDSAASIDTGYVGCDGATELTFDTCWLPTAITSMAINVGSNYLIVNGTNFFGGPTGTTPGTMIVIGPGGGQILYNLISATATQYVLELTVQYDEDFDPSPFTVIPGTYCVVWSSPCT